MDLIFKRYSSPFLLLDNAIRNDNLYSFVEDVVEYHNDDKLYGLWLHRVFDKDYDTFKKEAMNTITNNSKSIDTIVEESLSVLNQIKPS